MSLAIQIDVTDSITPRMRAAKAAMEPSKLDPLIGRSAVNFLRGHFEKLDASRPNKLGGKRQHFYGGAGRSTHFNTIPGGVRVSISALGLRLQFQGGVVRPGVNPSATSGGPTKYLTIPAVPEAYGHRASDFPNLQPVLRFKNGQLRMIGLATTATPSVGVKGSHTTGTILFWTVKQTVHAPDPSVLPDNQVMLRAINRDVKDYMDAVLLKRPNNPSAS